MDQGMTRLPDWQSRLHSYIAACKRQPYAPGKMDCAVFTRGAVRAMTGTDHGFDYDDHASGMADLVAQGFADHVAFTASLLPEVTAGEATPGDVAVVQGDPGLALGIVQGEYVYLVGLRGVGTVPISQALRVFRV